MHRSQWRPFTNRLPLELDNSYIMAEYACHEGIEGPTQDEVDAAAGVAA